MSPVFFLFLENLAASHCRMDDALCFFGLTLGKVKLRSMEPLHIASPQLPSCCAARWPDWLSISQQVHNAGHAYEGLHDAKPPRHTAPLMCQRADSSTSELSWPDRPARSASRRLSASGWRGSLLPHAATPMRMHTWGWEETPTTTPPGTELRGLSRAVWGIRPGTPQTMLWVTPPAGAGAASGAAELLLSMIRSMRAQSHMPVHAAFCKCACARLVQACARPGLPGSWIGLSGG